LNTLLGIDWIELYNPSNQTVDMLGQKLFANNTCCIIEDTVIEPYGYCIFYPQNIIYSEDNAAFIDDENVMLVSNTSKITDMLKFVACNSDRSFGAYPDGSDNIMILEPSEGLANRLVENELNKLTVFPNPCSSEIKVNINADFLIVDVKVYNQFGNCVYTDNGTQETSMSLTLNTSSWSDGIYFVSFVGTNKTCNTKFEKLK
jgi:hypothetical protein